MRHRSPLAFAGVFIILLLAVMGFAAFSTAPVETAQTAEGVVLPPTASGRIAGAVIGSGLVTAATAVPATEAPADNVPVATSRSQIDTAPALETELSTTTTAPPTTTTAAPTTTTAAPTATTTPPTTTAPPTTTTTAPPPTTTAPPTTTTAPPTDDDAPPAAHPPTVEQWRSLVATYWPADLVDDALTVINCESNGDPGVVNAASGAAGLFQFIPSTWESASASAGWGGADVLDPAANVAVAWWLYGTYATPWQAWHCKP